MRRTIITTAFFVTIGAVAAGPLASAGVITPASSFASGPLTQRRKLSRSQRLTAPLNHARTKRLWRSIGDESNRGIRGKR
jgi:hypothetical protein